MALDLALLAVGVLFGMEFTAWAFRRSRVRVRDTDAARVRTEIHWPPH